MTSRRHPQIHGPFRERRCDGYPVDQALTEIAELTDTKVATLRAAIAQDPSADFAYLVKGVTIDVLRQVQALGVPWGLT